MARLIKTKVMNLVNTQHAQSSRTKNNESASFLLFFLLVLKYHNFSYFLV